MKPYVTYRDIPSVERENHCLLSISSTHRRPGTERQVNESLSHCFRSAVQDTQSEHGRTMSPLLPLCFIAYGSSQEHPQRSVLLQPVQQIAVSEASRLLTGVQLALTKPQAASHQAVHAIYPEEPRLRRARPGSVRSASRSDGIRLPQAHSALTQTSTHTQAQPVNVIPELFAAAPDAQDRSETPRKATRE